MSEITNYPQWLDELRHRKPGETAGEHVARIVRGCEGLSLLHDASRLAALFLATEPIARATLVAAMRTNCATFYRECIVLAGCTSPHVIEPYVCGTALANDEEAAADAGATLPATRWRELGPGWGMLYYATGNDAHVEVCLNVPDALGTATHGGGGRADNAITIERGSILSSRGRPLRAIWDPARLCALPATGDDPY